MMLSLLSAGSMLTDEFALLEEPIEVAKIAAAAGLLANGPEKVRSDGLKMARKLSIRFRRKRKQRAKKKEKEAELCGKGTETEYFKWKRKRKRVSSFRRKRKRQGNSGKNKYGNFPEI
jgi:Mg-chelatase subunit ChlI